MKKCICYEDWLSQAEKCIALWMNNGVEKTCDYEWPQGNVDMGVQKELDSSEYEYKLVCLSSKQMSCSCFLRTSWKAERVGEDWDFQFLISHRYEPSMEEIPYMANSVGKFIRNEFLWGSLQMPWVFVFCLYRLVSAVTLEADQSIWFIK